jgi:hypothetical protein
MILKTPLMTQFMVLSMNMPEPTQEAYQTHTPIAGNMPEI